MDSDPHSPPAILNKELSSFVRDCKRVCTISGNPRASLFLQGHGAKGFLLKDYGILKHMPAVRAELCLSEENSRKLHEMLCTLRLVKGGANKGLLKASALPLPRVEPWTNLLNQSPPILPQLLQDRRSRQQQAIDIKGARGDGRGSRPDSFSLRCPHCGAIKECAKHKLCTTSARCVTCRACLRNTTSLKWSCSHGIPWHNCPSHRENGLWCGSGATPSFRSGKRPAPDLTQTRLQNKRRKLGSLGQGAQQAPTALNSAPSPSSFEFQKKIKRN